MLIMYRLSSIIMQGFKTLLQLVLEGVEVAEGFLMQKAHPSWVVSALDEVPVSMEEFEQNLRSFWDMPITD